MDTLSGGIVFAKEEAWEKLQSKLEHKPAQKFLIPYYRVAAGLLVLIVCACLYNVGRKTTSNPNEIVKTVASPVSTNPVAPQVRTTKQESNTTSQPVVNHHSIAKQKSFASTDKVPISSELVAANSIVAPVATIPLSDTALLFNSVGTKPEPVSNAPIAIVSKSEKTDINKLPVIHIDELEKSSSMRLMEIQTFRLQQGMSWGRLQFRGRLSISENYSDLEESSHSFNPAHIFSKSQN